MKKVIAVILTLCCLSAALPVPALIPANTNVVNSNIYTELVNNYAEDQAEALKALGLFLGTDNGFELNRALTRAEAAALIVRTLGAENAALSEKTPHPFKDVPAWADGYVGWLYRNKITNGVSASEYGSGQPVTYWQFATLLSRACSGDDNFSDNGVGNESEQSLCDMNGFHRADAVGLLTRFLACIYSLDPNEYITVAQHLVREGVFSAERFFEVGVRIYPIEYYYFDDDGGLTVTILGIHMVKSTLKGIEGNSAYPPTELSYFYALTGTDSETILYKMNCLTLEETEIGRFDVSDPNGPKLLDYFATVGGKDYLEIESKLIQVEGDKAEIIAEGTEFGFRYSKYAKPFIWHDNVLVIMLDDTAYVATKDGISGHKLDSGVSLVAVQDTIAVLCREENGETVIEGVNIEDWTVTDTYRAALSEKAYFPRIGQDDNGIYGEAGLFIVRDGRLIRVTERPVRSVSGVRYGAAGTPVILTHEPGDYFGDTIIVLNDPLFTGEDGWSETIHLQNDPPHGIMIDSIEGRDSAVFFYSRAPVGMEHYDVFTYVAIYNTEEDHQGILVYSFSPGRPEVMNHDNQWYVDREQERLNALGYNPW